MSIKGKKYLKAKSEVDTMQHFNAPAAIENVLKYKFAKFDESVSADFVLGIDAAKGDQVVRGSVLLPHGTGKRSVVVAFVKGDYEEAAKKAGADYVGLEDLVEKIAAGWTDFDHAIATPDVMGALTKVAKILGPRGLLPNKKTGTVTFDVAPIITSLKKGLVSFRNDKGGGLHIGFGKSSFGAEKLKENFAALLKAVASSRPSAARGKFIRKIVVSSTQGLGFKVSLDEVIG